jgi:hypothetical protein
MPGARNHQEDIEFRGATHLVVDHSGRVIELQKATQFIGCYTPPPSAPRFAKEGEYPVERMCTIV